MKRDFNEWLASFKNSICDYKFYVDFEKVYGNVDNIKVELNIDRYYLENKKKNILRYHFGQRQIANRHPTKTIVTLKPTPFLLVFYCYYCFFCN